MMNTCVIAGMAGHIDHSRWRDKTLGLAFIFWVAWMGLCFQGKSQDFDHYKPLQSVGPIPEELRTSSSQKYARELALLGDSAKGREGRVRDNFLLQSNFVLDELLLSGRVIFNDPVTEYVSRVKNLILRNEPELQQRIRIYIVRSPAVNAFATNNGTLLVNMGLLAHLQNEAELAFVLCHEIQHYLHKHPINSYVKAEELRSNARLFGLNTAEDYIAARTRYSRSLELAADAMGFELFRKSGYTLSAAEGVFDMLDYSDRPFDELPWDASFFEWEYLQFPPEFTKWPLDSIPVAEDDDDSLSTHPNTGKRRAVIAEKIAAAGEDQGETFQIGAELFLDVRKRCRFELSELYLGQHAFEHCIYNSYLLLQEEPESHYLRKCIAQALYGLCAYRNARKFEAVHMDADNASGHFQQLLYFMESMDREAMTILALREVWKTYLGEPDDVELHTIAIALLDQLFRKHYETADWLAHAAPTDYPEILNAIQTAKKAALEERGQVQDGDDGKMEDGEEEAAEDENVAEEASEAAKKEDKNAFMEWSITDLFENETFADAWADHVENGVEKKDWEQESPTEAQRGKAKKARLEGYHLGVDKVVLIQPLYKNVDLRSRIPVQYIASEASLESYKETLAEMASRNEVEFEFLENRNLEEGDVEAFNDVSTMLLWFGEYLSAQDDNLKLVNYHQDEAQALIDRYGTKYFAWNAVISLVEPKSSMARYSWIMMGIVLWPILPYAIVKASLPEKKTLFVNLVFDLEKSRVIMEDYRILKAKDKHPMVRSVIFDTFLQIKSKQ